MGNKFLYTDSSDILFLTEYLKPAVGRSAFLLHDIYPKVKAFFALMFEFMDSRSQPDYTI